MTLTPSPMACLDRGGRVGAEAAAVATDLEHLDVGARRDARDRAARDAEDAGRDARVAGRGRRGVRAVAVVVTGRGELAGRRAGPTSASYVAMNRYGADELVVAGERPAPGVDPPLNSQARVPASAARRRRRTACPTGPDRRTTDARARCRYRARRRSRPRRRSPGRRGCPRRPGAPMKPGLVSVWTFSSVVRVNGLDARQLGHGRDQSSGTVTANRIQDEVVFGIDLRALDLLRELAREGVLLALQERAIAGRVGALEVDGLGAARLGVRGRETAHATRVGGHRNRCSA